MFNSYHGYSLGLSPLFFIGFGMLAAIIAYLIFVVKKWHKGVSAPASNAGTSSTPKV